MQAWYFWKTKQNKLIFSTSETFDMQSQLTILKVLYFPKTENNYIYRFDLNLADSYRK